MEKIKKIARVFKLIFKINWIKTLYINFKTQKFSDAIKLPIVVYGKLNIYSLKGKIILKCPIKFGTVQFGKDFDHFPGSTLPIKLLINNKLIFNGPTIISGGTTITSWSGVINIGKYTSIGSSNTIKSNVAITIGDYSRIVSNCNIMDTNVHFIINGDNKINNIFGEIVVGNYCWINAGTILNKGTKLPNYTITSRNCYVDKDFSNEDEGLFLVGSPAIIKSRNLKKVFNYKNELKLKNYFLKNLTEIQVDLSFISKTYNYVENDEDFMSFYKII